MKSTLVYIRSPIVWIRVGLIKDTIPLHMIAKIQLVVSHAVHIEAIVACLFSETKGIQPGSAESYLLLYEFDPTGVLDPCFVYRYQVIVDMLAVSRLEG